MHPPLPYYSAVRPKVCLFPKTARKREWPSSRWMIVAFGVLVVVMVGWLVGQRTAAKNDAVVLPHAEEKPLKNEKTIHIKHDSDEISGVLVMPSAREMPLPPISEVDKAPARELLSIVGKH